MRALGGVKLLILDDFGLEPLGDEQRHDILEILEDRYGRGATLITSQIPLDKWHSSSVNPPSLTPSSIASSTTPTACNSAAIPCAAAGRQARRRLTDRTAYGEIKPSSGHSATPADINRNGRPTSIGMGGRHQSESPADIIGIRNQLALELGKNAEREAAIGGRRIDLRARAGQHLQPDAPGAQVLDRVDQVTQIAPELVELPEDQRVAGLDRLQAGGQPRAGIVAARRQVLLDAGGIDAGRQHRVPLRRQRLGAVRLGDTDIANQHRGTGRASGKKKPTLQAGDQFRNGFSGGLRRRSAGRARSPGNRPFSKRLPAPPPRDASVSRICVEPLDLASVSPIVRPVSNSVRRNHPTVSANLRRKTPLIARRAVHHCAPLHIGRRSTAGSRCPTIPAIPRS